MTPIDDLARRLARLDIPGAAPTESIEPEESDQARLIGAVAQNRVLGIAVRAVEGGVLTLGTEHEAALFARHDEAMEQTLRAELTMLTVCAALDEASVGHRVLKGAALAHTIAVDPADREFRDVDVLVAGRQMDEAVAVVQRLGGERLQPELRPGFDSRFGKSVTLRLDGVEVDLHRTLAPGPFGEWMFPDDLFLLVERFAVADRSLPTLDRTDHLVHACYHAALGQARPVLSNLRDIALLAAGPWDRDRFAGTVDRWRGRPAVARAVALASEALGVDLGDLGEIAPAATDDDAVLAPYLEPGDRFPGLAIATLRALPTRDRARFALAVGFPSGTSPVDRARELASQRPWRSIPGGPGRLTS